MSAGFASAQHHGADGCYQNDYADDLKRQIVIVEKQKTDSVDIVRCRSCQRWKGLFRETKSADDSENLDHQGKRNRQAAGGRDPVNFSQLLSPQIEQHDDEKKQHHDRAGVDEHLDDPDEVGIERHKQRCERQKRDDETERARDRITVDDNGYAEYQHHQRENPKQKYRHITMLILRSLFLVPFQNDSVHHPADLEQFVFVMHHVFASESGNGVIFPQINRLLRTNFFTHAAENAADHVDIEFFRIFLDLGETIRL